MSNKTETWQQKLKDCIPRESILNLDDLVRKANRVEERWMEKASSTSDNHPGKYRPVENHLGRYGSAENHPGRYGSAENRQGKYRPVEDHLKEYGRNTENRNKNFFERCQFCKSKGHNEKDCRKRAFTEVQPITQKDVEKPKFSCYGCGAPGVVRIKYPRCAPKIPFTSTAANPAEFYAVQNSDAVSCRPIIQITIGKTKGKVLLDTGAKLSVISTDLYEKLVSQNYLFTTVEMDIKMGDGITHRMNVETTRIPIKILRKVVTTKCIKFPGKINNKTLLGAQFVKDADIVINTPQGTWWFADRPGNTQSLIFETCQGDPEIGDALSNILNNVLTMMSPMTATPVHTKPDKDFQQTDSKKDTPGEYWCEEYYGQNGQHNHGNLRSRNSRSAVPSKSRAGDSILTR